MVRLFKFLFLLSITFIFSQTICSAADIVLQWEPNTEPDLAGYKIYYDVDSGYPYSGTGAIYYNGQQWVQGVSPIIIPLEILGDDKNPEVTLQGLDSSNTYYFSVTAFDNETLESDYSNEVSTETSSSTDYTITVSVQSNGSISPAGPVSVEYGSAQTFTIIPADGYHIEDVKVDGISVGPVETYVFDNIYADHSIVASFIQNGDLNEIVVDTGDNSSSSTGSWTISGGDNPYGDLSLYSKQVGATYAFESSASGYYEVSMWWTDWNSRCSEVPVEIYDGEILLDTVYVNQLEDGGQWNVLGSYEFSGTAWVVIISEGECSTNADAVKFINQSDSSSQDNIPDSSSQAILIDNGDSGTSSTGSWTLSGGANPYEDSSLYSKQVDAIYTFESSVSGDYEVSLWWTDWTSRCSEVPVEIYDGEILLDTVYVNQLEDGGQWNIIGSYEFSGTARIVIISEGECSTNADAVKFINQSDSSSQDNIPDSSSQTILIDNGDSETSSTGGWAISGASNPYGDSSLYSKQLGATYTFESFISGYYEVSLWWTYWASRCSEIPVEIYDGEILLDTVYVDQQANEEQWNLLDIYEFSGIARVVIISKGECSTNADAAKFVFVP